MKYLAVVTTVGDRETAQRLAEALVARRLAACVQISGIESVYRWEGEVCREPEFRVLCKTTEARYAEVESAILELHPYDLPAVHAFDLARVSAPYAAWIESNTG